MAKTFGVEVKGIKQLVQTNKALFDNLDRAAKSTLDQEAIALISAMKAAAPIGETGLLRMSITSKIWKDQKGVRGIVVGVDPYGKYNRYFQRSGKGYYPASQEYGWGGKKGEKSHPGKPYIRPSFNKRKNKTRKALEAAWKSEIEKVRSSGV
jgi:hypothetical protein